MLALATVLCILITACTSVQSQDDPRPRSLDEALNQAEPPPDEHALRQSADVYRLDNPPTDVEFERYISPDEYAAVMVPCLTEQGIPATPLGDGGISFGDIEPEQGQLQREGMYRCSARFPVHPLFADPLDEDQLRRLYEYLVDDLAPCLEREGYSTPPPPSLEAFMSSYSDPDADVWSPYPVEDSRLEEESEWYRLNEVCPQIPPLETLYGAKLTP